MFTVFYAYSYSFFRFGFMGNQPFNTRFRWSNISLMVQNDEKEKTPKREEISKSDITMEPIIPMIPNNKNIHQQRVPQ